MKLLYASENSPLSIHVCKEHPNAKPIPIGQKFNRLLVLSESFPRITNAGNKHKKVICRCECGNLLTATLTNVNRNKTQSCGCLGAEVRKVAKVTHGHSANGKCTKTYETWQGMRTRCYNPKSEDYPNYGGRGIKICFRWRGKYGFENFLKDMGERPKGMTIDRIDSNKSYYPANCRWATNKTQARNQRTNAVTQEEADKIKRLRDEGYFKRHGSQAEYARQLGVSPVVVNSIVKGHTWA